MTSCYSLQHRYTFCLYLVIFNFKKNWRSKYIRMPALYRAVMVILRESQGRLLVRTNMRSSKTVEYFGPCITLKSNSEDSQCKMVLHSPGKPARSYSSYQPCKTRTSKNKFHRNRSLKLWTSQISDSMEFAIFYQGSYKPLVSLSFVSPATKGMLVTDWEIHQNAVQRVDRVAHSTLREHVPTATGFRVPWRNSSIGALNVIFVHPKLNVSLFFSYGMIVYPETMRDNLFDRMKASNDDILGDVKKNSSATFWAARLGRYMDNLRFWDHPRADGVMSHGHQATRLPTSHSRTGEG